MSIVYIVQEPFKLMVDKETQSQTAISQFNITPAEKYGELCVLFNPGPVALHPSGVIKTLENGLQHYSDTDFIVPIGDPVLIGVVTAIAAGYNNGRVKFLRWDKRAHKYTVLTYNV